MIDLAILLLAGLGVGFAALLLSEKLIRRYAPMANLDDPAGPERRTLGDYLAVALNWITLALCMGVIFGMGVWLAG